MADSVSGREVVITTIAMYLLQDYTPRLFQSETAFRAQLVRRVRCLSASSFSEWGGAEDGRGRRAITHLEPRAVEQLAGILVELFGEAGVRVAQLERKEEEDQRNALLDMNAALAEVA